MFLYKKNRSRRTIFLYIIFLLVFLRSNYLRGSMDRDGSKYQEYLTSFEEAEKFLIEGQFDKALESFETSLNYARATGNEEGEVDCYKSIGLTFWNLGHLEKSEEFYTKAHLFAKRYGLTSAKTEFDSYYEIFRLYTDGKTNRILNDHQRSINCFQQALALARANQSRHHELKCLRQLSLTYWELNDLKHFYELNKQGLKIAKDLNHKREIGRALNNIGLYFWKTNEYSKALSFYQEALTIARELDDKVEMSACFNNIGVVFKELGAYINAFDYIGRAIKIDTDLSNKLFLSFELNNLGIISHRIAQFSGLNEDFFKALNYFENSLDIAQSIKDVRTEVRALNNIGNIYLDLEKYNDAMMYLKRGLQRSELARDEEAMSMILNNIGNANVSLYKIDEAEKSFKKAAEMSKRLSRGEILWEAYFGLGRCYESRDEYIEASHYYKKAISVIDRIRSQITVDTYKSSFARNKQKVYESLIRLLYRLKENGDSKDLGEIFHVVESAKARAFLETLGESKVDIRERLTPQLKEQEKKISNQISSAIRELTSQELSENQRMRLSQELKGAEDDYGLLLQKIRVEVPEVANMVAPVPCRLDQVQDQITDNKTALIEYFIGEKESYVFFITKRDIWLHLLPGRDGIWRSLKAYLKALSDHPDSQFRGTEASKRLAKELLFLGQWRMPVSIENLIIIPDGVLYYLPFETLIFDTQEMKPSENLLISKYKISYAPSSSSLLFLFRKSKRDYPNDLLALGNPAYTWNGKTSKKNVIPSEILKEVYQNEGFDLTPLPYSEREVKGISKFFHKTKRDVYLNREASEKIIKNLALDNYQILHFACHAILDERFPFRSALVLSKEDSLDEDGFLQVSEIYHLRLASDLVILSACQTGKGCLEKGEGVLGLPRIFFYSGAKSVVSTLWKIDDKSTAIFMKHFYSFLSQSMDKAQALRLAKLEMIRSKYSHPFYWAAFVLNGEYSSKVSFGRRD
jgi:CHAT domain-containing protein/Tfp pilus assembly protein PilF